MAGILPPEIPRGGKITEGWIHVLRNFLRGCTMIDTPDLQWSWSPAGWSGRVRKIPGTTKEVYHPFQVYANPREGHPNDYSVRPGIVNGVIPTIEGVSLIQLPVPPSLPISYQDFVWIENTITAGTVTSAAIFSGPEVTPETDEVGVKIIGYMGGYFPDGATEPVLQFEQFLRNNLNYMALPGFFVLSGGGSRSIAHEFKLV